MQITMTSFATTFVGKCTTIEVVDRKLDVIIEMLSRPNYLRNFGENLVANIIGNVITNK